MLLVLFVAMPSLASLLQPALEKAYNTCSFVLGTLVLFLCLRFHIAGRVCNHHDQRLVVHAVQDVVNTPARRTRYRPYKTERAMGAFPTAL